MDLPVAQCVAQDVARDVGDGLDGLLSHYFRTCPHALPGNPSSAAVPRTETKSHCRWVKFESAGSNLIINNAILHATVACLPPVLSFNP